MAGLDTCLAEAVDDVVNRQYGTEREGTVATGRLAQACDESVRARQQASGTQSDTLMLDVATISAWGDGRASRGNMRM